LRRAPAPEEFWALRGVDFEIAEGEAVGIIGGNGAGKSTLLKILSRITPPTEGRARVKGRLSSLLEVGTGFHPELTGRENVFLNGAILGMRKAEVERKFDEIVAFAGVEKFIDTPVKRYSSGMYVRLAFAVAAHLEPDVLIIDEVLAVGDAEFQNRCLGKMSDVAKAGRTVLFVSHNMAAVQRLCSRAIWMRNGAVEADGDPQPVVSSYISNRSEPKETLETGVLFLDEGGGEAAESAAVRLTKLEILDDLGALVGAARTWEPLRIRLTIKCSSHQRSFSPDIVITTPDGVPLLRSSVSPDRGPPLSLEPGVHQIECRFAKIPLAQGDYLVNVRMTVPRIEVLSRVEPAARLTVMQNDIFDSGIPPAARRYLVATEHDWGRIEKLGADVGLPAAVI
jgi:lipopolysaccharide transport system ATP-binding protein